MSEGNITFFCIVLYVMILAVIAFKDWKTKTISNQLILLLFCCAILHIIFQTEVEIGERVIAFFVISTPMLVCTCIRPGAFGGGDIKLMAVSGLILGVEKIILAFMIGIILSGVYILYLRIRKRVERTSAIPIGPWLSMGCFIALVYGDRILVAIN